MPGRPTSPGVRARLLGVLALLVGLVAMHGALTWTHEDRGPTPTTTAAGATVAAPLLTAPASVADARPVASPRSRGNVDAGAPPCPTDHHGQSAAAMDCASAVVTAGLDSDPLAGPLVSHPLPPAALPQWPSPRAAAFAPPAAAPSHVILRT